MRDSSSKSLGNKTRLTTNTDYDSMNIKKNRQLIALQLLLIGMLTLAGCSSLKTTEDTPITHEPSAEQHATASPESAVPETPASNENLWDDVVKGYGLPPVSDERVGKHLRWFANNQRYLDKVTEQSKPYLYYVTSQLRANDLPLELALLPIVESAYDPFVVSPSRAAGVWQFIPLTARNFGLKQNSFYDGRRDIVASTDAAIRYLKRLNAMFDGDWLLTIAAYNAGEGTVGRAIKRNRSAGKAADFWSLPLSQQTQSYVPQLVALSKVIANPAKYELTLNPIPNNPYFTSINVSSAVDLAQAARMANINPKELRLLNAGYSRWVTDTAGPHQLLVPVADAPEFTLTLGKLPKIAPVKVSGDYRVKSGDTLGAIAKRFGTSVAAIKSLNGLKDHNLRINQQLQIPGQETVASEYAQQAEQELAKRTTQTNPTYYKVQSGDNLWTIAKKHGTSVKNLLSLNNLPASTKLKPGQKLLVKNTEVLVVDGNKVTYQIKSGDTLSKIATKFSVSKKDILSWNKVKDESYIHPGQELTIYLTAKN